MDDVFDQYCIVASALRDGNTLSDICGPHLWVAAGILVAHFWIATL
jgi:hypothetical protein